ncbi:DUF2066 domain-containing protein [Eionea flava]
MATKVSALVARYTSLCTVFVLMLTVAMPAAAEKQVDIFTDAQLVLDQSVGLRQQAMRASLELVLIRAVGDVNVVNYPEVREALSAPSAYVNQYRYASTEEMIVIAGAARPAQQLFLQFSQPAIERLLKTSKIAMWRELRPEVLLWVATDNQGKRIADATSAIVTTTRRAAALRGVPLALPLLDLTDRQALSAPRLWARDEVAINRASQRYGADAVLAGRVVGLSGGVQRANFILTYDRRAYYFSAESDNTAVLMQNIIDQSMVVLAKSNAVILADNNVLPTITVAVGNVSSFASYATILQRLEGLPSVSRVNLREVGGEYLIADLRYQTTQDRVRTQLSRLEGFESVSDELFISRYWQPAVDIVQLSDASEVDNSDIGSIEVENREVEVLPAPSEVPVASFPRIDAALIWNVSE